MSVFSLEIITPQKRFFEGDVSSLVCHTDSGDLGILKGHQDMVVSLEVGEIRFLAADGWKKAFVSQGFLLVQPSGTVVFAQTAEWPDEIDEARAESARLRALEHLKQAHTPTETKHSEISLSRAVNRLKIKQEEKSETDH